MTPTEQLEKPSRVLAPVERLSEILFGLIMVLTFTGSLSVATADRGEVKAMLIGAIGCNIAWGLIDAIMYLMGCVHERDLDRQLVAAVKTAGTPERSHDVLRRAVPAVISSELTPQILERARLRVLDMPHEPSRLKLHMDDLRGALGVFLIVVASTFPVIVPFIVLSEVSFAMRVSNAIAVAMLAFIGFAYGRAAGLSQWWTATSMVLLGVILVALTIALGG